MEEKLIIGFMVLGMLVLGCTTQEQQVVEPVETDESTRVTTTLATDALPPRTTQTTIQVSQEAIDRRMQLCESQEDPDARNRCFANLATRTGNAEVCNNIGDILLRDRCLNNIVRTSGDTSYCVQISDSGLRERCYALAEMTR
jgi:hypothetical protein